jgi:large subunit ribosomal protein L15
MVVRKEKRNRKYLGSRHWGLGNIKNGRGSGDRGGVGKGSRKPRWTWTVKHPELIGHKGFHPWGQKKMKWITLNEINNMLYRENKDTLELNNYKVLSNGNLDYKVTIKASSFSKKAIEKIQAADGKAEVLK